MQTTWTAAPHIIHPRRRPHQFLKAVHASDGCHFLQHHIEYAGEGATVGPDVPVRLRHAGQLLRHLPAAADICRNLTEACTAATVQRKLLLKHVANRLQTDVPTEIGHNAA